MRPDRRTPGCAECPRSSLCSSPSCLSSRRNVPLQSHRESGRSTRRPRGIAAEHLAHDRRFGLVNLEERVRMLGLLDTLANGAGEDRHRAGPRAMQLPAATTLRDLRPLVLGDHPLVILRSSSSSGAPGPLGLLREDHLDPRLLELLQQQHLRWVPTREPIRRVDRPRAALDRHITQPLQLGGATPPEPRDALILDNALLLSSRTTRRQAHERGGRLPIVCSRR